MATRIHTKTPLYLGPATNLRPISELCDQIPGFKIRRALKFLRDLAVPIMYIGRECYFLQDALEIGLRGVLRHGGPGFAAPGSTYRRKYGGSPGPGQTPVTFPLDLLKPATHDRIVREADMVARRNSGASSSDLRRVAELIGRDLTPKTDVGGA